MDKERNSKLLNDRVDLKAMTYFSLSALIDALKSGKLSGISIGEESNAQILTSFGIVEGKLVPSTITEEEFINDKNKAASDVLINQVFEARDNSIVELETENPNLNAVNNSSAVILKEVSIIPYSNPNSKINLNYLILFSDEIKALSFGKMLV